MTLVAPGWSYLALTAALGFTCVARADQFIVTDVEYTHAADTTSDSHYRVDPKPGTPSNWKSPVDYSQGSAHVLLEVKTKPGVTATKFQICFEGPPAYACTNQSPEYTSTGKYEWTTPFANFYQGDGVGVDWSKGIKKVALILKDTMNNKPQGDPKYVPTALHVEVAILSKGATYVAPMRDAGVSDAGSGMATDAGAVRSDAGDAATPPARSDAAVDAQVSSDAGRAESDASTADAATPSTPTLDAATQRDAAGGATAPDAAQIDQLEPAEEAERSDAGCSVTPSPGRRSDLSLIMAALCLCLALWRRARAYALLTRMRAAAVSLLALGACGGGDEGPSNASPDANVIDAAAPDASVANDAATVMDATGAPDAANDAASAPDATSPDAATDGGDAGDDAGELDPSVPSRFLSETGLYSDSAQTVLASGVQLYQVRLELWADGATKKRYLYLPPGTKIDTTDPDAWVFPIGTKVWKEFTRDGKRVETRLIQKAAAGRSGWKYVAYAWNEAQTMAEAVPFGRAAAQGTAHDIPTQTNCNDCHEGSPDFVLGVSAFGLPIDGAGVSLAMLVQESKLTQPITAAQVAIPGNATAQAALGELHANCGSCHRPGTFAWERAELELRLKVGVKTLQETPTYQSAVNVMVGQIFENIPYRITPGKPEASAVYTRMTSRADMVGMPNIGTKIVDTAGSKRVADWIRSLTP